MMAKITKLGVGKSLVGEGNEVAHIDLMIGPRGSTAESAFAHALVNNKDGFTTLLAVVAPNLLAKPNTILFNKVTIKGAKQAVQMFGPAQHAVAKAVADSVAEGVIPADEADDLFICVGVFIHWEANDDKKFTTSTIALPKKRFPAPSAVSRRQPKSLQSAIPRNIRFHRPDPQGRDCRPQGEPFGSPFLRRFAQMFGAEAAVVQSGGDEHAGYSRFLQKP